MDRQLAVQRSCALAPSCTCARPLCTCGVYRDADDRATSRCLQITASNPHACMKRWKMRARYYVTTLCRSGRWALAGGWRRCATWWWRRSGGRGCCCRRWGFGSFGAVPMAACKAYIALEHDGTQISCLVRVRVASGCGGPLPLTCAAASLAARAIRPPGWPQDDRKVKLHATIINTRCVAPPAAVHTLSEPGRARNAYGDARHTLYGFGLIPLALGPPTA